MPTKAPTLQKILGRTYDQYRKDDGFYEQAQWRKLRKAIIDAEPLCRACRKEPAREVDHIVARKLCADPLLISNLQPLCKRCHSLKTQKENLKESKPAA